jgi:hypothetical protein
MRVLFRSKPAMASPLLCAGFAGLAVALAIGSAAAQIAIAPAPPAGVESRPGAEAVPRHRPVEAQRDAAGRVVRNVKNQAVTSAFSGHMLGASVPWTQASLQWTVPAVTFGQSTSTATQYSAIWVGIQGGSSTIAQLGTEQGVSSNGSTAYRAWYELYPAASQYLSNPVKPGDRISASVVCAAPCTPNTSQSWTLSMQNATQGWNFTQTFSFNNGAANYAEWIMEAPSGGGTLPLANYASANFTGVTANNAAPALSSASAMVLQDPYGQTSNVSGYASQGFQTCWGYSTYTPCGASSTPTVTASLSASPSSIKTGQTATLSWSSSNANNCAGTGFSTSDQAGGSAPVTPSATSTYAVSCTGSAGSASANTTVSVSSPTPCRGKKC